MGKIANVISENWIFSEAWILGSDCADFIFDVVSATLTLGLELVFAWSWVWGIGMWCLLLMGGG